MQEGIVSLMQMAKTSAAMKQHSDAGLLYMQCADKSYYRWCYGKLCHGGRYYSGRAGSIDWLCRTEGDSADHRTEIAGGISKG